MSDSDLIQEMSLGSPDPAPAPPATIEPEPEPASGEDQPDLEEAGQKALATERAARKAAEKAARAHQKQLADMEKQIEDMQTAGLSEAERAVKQAQAEVRDQVTAEYSDRLLTANIRAQAGQKFVDLDAVIALVDRDVIDGPDDLAGIEEALSALASQKPYLTAMKNVPQLAGNKNEPARNSGGSMNDLLRNAAGSRS